MENVVYSYNPQVDQSHEFIEIAKDFSNPLEIVREAISNSFDATAENIELLFNVEKKYGSDILIIQLNDDGCGMDENEIKAFFDLGNSPKRDLKLIGDKGHGTKVYFNSSKIEVETLKFKTKITATMDEPIKKLHDKKIPEVKYTKESVESNKHYTKIKVTGYNNNRKDLFTHEILLDYVLWFTKFGSVEMEFQERSNENVKLLLKGLNVDSPQSYKFGHIFPSASPSPDKLFDKYFVQAPDNYSKKIINKGFLKYNPQIPFQAIFSIEGNKVKQNYNKMIRRQGVNQPGAYTIQDRYGLWICKDFIPIVRKNEWIVTKGHEYTRFHAFVNCQSLNLTANRGTIENTPAEILEDLKVEVKKIYEKIISGDDWRELSYLEEEAESTNTKEKEKKDYQFRINKANKANIANYKGLTLVEPNRESGVFTIMLLLMSKVKNLFPFQILDYDTYNGFDILVKGDPSQSINQSKLFYVELKYILKDFFNHSFENLRSIVCWDTYLKNDENVKDICQEERTLKIVPPANSKDYTKYLLDNPGKISKIEVFVLKDYLRQKLNIDFRPRDSNSIE